MKGGPYVKLLYFIMHSFSEFNEPDHPQSDVFSSTMSLVYFTKPRKTSYLWVFSELQSGQTTLTLEGESGVRQQVKFDMLTCSERQPFPRHTVIWAWKFLTVSPVKTKTNYQQYKNLEIARVTNPDWVQMIHSDFTFPLRGNFESLCFQCR